MSLTKKCLKSKPICKVTFKMPKDMAREAGSITVVGEFNNWDIVATPMKKQKDGSFLVTVDLEVGREYQFRYLIDGEVWVSDPAADRYVFSPFGDCDNAVVQV